MKLKQIIYCSVIFACCIGCKDEIKVTLPDNYSNEIQQYIKQQQYMVMIYVDSSDCTPCSLKPLFRWNSLKDKLEKNGIGVLLIFRNSDERVVARSLKLIGTLHFIIDKGGKFKVNNKFYKYIKDNIFVMDKDNNVVMTQSPIANEKTWKSFIKIITR
jgi:peroxiredoxin